MQRDEQTLQTSQEHLQAALDGGHMGAWSWSPVTNQSQADARTLALFGVDSATFQLDTNVIFARIHPADLPMVSTALAQAQQPGGTYHAEFRVQLPDGQERWLAGVGRGRFDEHGQLQLVYGVNFDITARKQAEGDARLLAELGEQIAAADDADALMDEVVGRVGRHLGVARCCFAEVDAPNDSWRVIHEYAAGIDPLAGTYRLSDYPPAIIATMRSGELLISADTSVDPVAAGFYERAYAPIGARAHVVVPLLRQRAWVSNLVVLHTAPRQWQAREVTLLTTVAERSWNAVERLRLDAALRANEARYRMLLDSIDQGFCRFAMLYDPDGTPNDYRFLEVNATFEQHTGLRDVVGRTARELVPELEPFWFATYGRVAATGEPLRFEQGSAVMGRLFEVEAVRVGPAEQHEVALIFTDVTERRRTEVQLAAVAARDRYLIQLADALRPLQRAVEIEEMATRVLGEQLGASRVAYFEVDGDDYVAERYYSAGVASPAGRFASTSFGQQQLALYQAGRTVIAPDVAADPELSPSEQATYAMFQIGAHVGVPLVKGGRFVAGLAVHHQHPHAWTTDEVTLIEETAERTWAAIERARAEARLQELYAQEQAARQAAEEANQIKDEFLATVSHELRTPLTAFLGYTQLLLRRQSFDETYVRRTLEKMAHSAQAQAALVEDLLDVSRVISGKLRIAPAPIELLTVIDAALDTIRPALESKRLTVELVCDPAASPVYGDANRLQQVVWNLLANAAKFSPPDGQIRIGLALADGQAELTVRDAGQGIDAAFLPFVFDRFRQADSTSQRSHGGLGLGLSIVRHLVELHGGTVAASSAGLGHGATFTVRLPLAKAGERLASDTLRTEAGTVDPPHRPLQGVRLVLVDDQAEIRELLESMLAEDGATVRTCATAPEALALLQDWRPDLLVSDIAMPGADGYWLIDQIQRLAPESGGATPAIALTAYVRMEHRLQVLQAGFQQYVTKPVDAAELRAVILRVIADHTEP